MGELKVSDKRVIDHLMFKDGLSYWWMMPFFEQSFYTIPLSIFLRLLAMEEILLQNKYTVFRLVSSNKQLHIILSALCKNLAIKYGWRKCKKKAEKFDRKAAYKVLPMSIQAAMKLFRLYRGSQVLKNADTTSWVNDKSIFICGYFANIIKSEANEGCFGSKYWGGLPALLEQLGIKSNWLHHNVHYNHNEAVKWVSDFNKKKECPVFHTFLEAFISRKILFCVIKRWLYLRYKYWRIKGIKKNYKLSRTSLHLWPLVNQIWKDSLIGPLSIANLLVIELYESAISQMPYQNMGLYLYENHSWERALIHAWNKHKHGKLIGVAHTTVRYWDLRYFIDPRYYQQLINYTPPLPAGVALNGSAACKMYDCLEYPKEIFVECEALRYNDLKNLVVSNPSGQPPWRMLIVGDILKSSTEMMLRILKASMPRLLKDFSFTIKLHPACPMQEKSISCLGIDITNDPLDKILSKYDIVFASDSTSAAVEAYVVGLPVLVMLDVGNLNRSPLRGCREVLFIRDADEMLISVERAMYTRGARSFGKDMFYLDSNLPKWKKMFASCY